MTSSATGSLILSPLNRHTFIAFLIMIQAVKLAIILSQPNSAGFIQWFYGFHKYPPYSFDNTIDDPIRGIYGVPFPVPYSMLWYTFYWITRFGYWTFNLTTFSLDALLLFVVASNHSQFYTAYIAQMSMYFLIISPQDFLIFMFIVIGRVRPFFLLLAVLTKFPLIPPILNPAIWNFIFTNPYAIHDPLNWARYSIIATVFLTSLFLWGMDTGRLTRSRIVNKILPRSFLEFAVRK